MKYGIVMHGTTQNFGDEIQSYAASRLLPQVDVFADREHLDSFQTEDGEPAAIVMAAWWLWQKWNWPPSEYIIPLLTSIHVNNDGIRQGASPVLDAWTKGLGGEYLRAYGPVGARDFFSKRFFEERGIETYFSGCITLTLPKQKTTADAGSYICLVDLGPKVKEKARTLAEKEGLEVREMTHKCDYRNSQLTPEERLAEAERVLTIYQNARCVVTRRLHVSLPCLAMETPVLAVLDTKAQGNINRWDAFEEWVYHVTSNEFLADSLTYDICHPPQNRTDYLETRQKLIREVQEFIRRTEKAEQEEKSFRKIAYTRQDVLLWQNDLMRNTLDQWMVQSRELVRELKEKDGKIKRLQKELREAKKSGKEAEAKSQESGVFGRMSGLFRK